MNKREREKRTKEIVKRELQYCPAHNFDHVTRVYNLAVRLAKEEDIDMEVVRLGSLLHDIAGKKELDDPTGKTDHALEGAKMAKTILEKLGCPEKKIRHIQDCIVSHRYRTNNKPETLEAKIIFDADKLETVGAIGIARAFVWVGRNGAHIYKKTDIKKYAKENLEGGSSRGRIKDKTKHSPQLNWETKDKHILKFLYTKKAKEIAKERIKITTDFFRRLEEEIKGIS